MSKDLLKRRYLESGLTKILTVCNFGNTLAMTMIFFLKCLMYDEHSKKGKKNGEKSVWSVRSYHLNTELQIPTIPKRIPVIGSQCVKKER